jgi:hypothetical protein
MLFSILIEYTTRHRIINLGQSQELLGFLSEGLCQRSGQRLLIRRALMRVEGMLKRVKIGPKK